MTPAPLHPDLGEMPPAKPVCISCGRTNEDDAVIVPLNGNTLMICGCCATRAAFEAAFEGGRRICMALLDVTDPVPAMRGVP